MEALHERYMARLADICRAHGGEVAYGELLASLAVPRPE